MENKNKKVNEIVDEKLLMAMMAGDKDQSGSKSEGQDTSGHPKKDTVPKAKPVKRSEADYISLFFSDAATNARNGKSVYIRPEYHERLTRIVQVIGEDKISIYAYLNNILAYHFSEFAAEITKNFEDKYKPIL